MIGERFVCTTTAFRSGMPRDKVGDDQEGVVHMISRPRRSLRRAPRPALRYGSGRARGRVLHPGRIERCAPTALVVARELQVVVLARAMPTAIRPMPDQESSHVRSAQSARSYDGRGSPAKPSLLSGVGRVPYTRARPGRAPGRSGRLGLAYAASACEPAVRSTAGLGIALYRRERSEARLVVSKAL